MSCMTGSAKELCAAQNPILSICIPTYNRAAYLSTLLENLSHNVSLRTQGLEIVVADNASTDETPSICRSYLGRLPLRLIRRPENIMGSRNYLRLIHAEAVGTFCLIMGDDDMIVLEGVDYLLQAIAAYSDSDFFIANFANAPYPEIQNAVRNAHSQFTGDFQPEGLVKVFDVRRFESFQDSIARQEFDFERYFSFLSVIFRREVCAEEAFQLDTFLATARLTDYLPEIWYSHYVMWLRTLKGGRGYFLPRSIIMQGVGSQCWAEERHLIGMWTQTFPLLYRELLFRGGMARSQQNCVRKEIVRHYWNGVFLSLKKRIWPFQYERGWFSQSARYFPILGRHPVRFLQFLGRVIAGFFRRYIKHLVQGKAFSATP